MSSAKASRAISQVSIALVLMILAVAGCSTRQSTGEDQTDSPSATATRTTESVGYNPPGPPGPTVPDDVGGNVGPWWKLLHRKSCHTLIAKATAVIKSDPAESTE